MFFARQLRWTIAKRKKKPRVDAGPCWCIPKKREPSQERSSGPRSDNSCREDVDELALDILLQRRSLEHRRAKDRTDVRGCFFVLLCFAAPQAARDSPVRCRFSSSSSLSASGRRRNATLSQPW